MCVCVCVWWSLCGMLLSINGPDCNAMCSLSLSLCVYVYVCMCVAFPWICISLKFHLHRSTSDFFRFALLNYWNFWGSQLPVSLGALATLCWAMLASFKTTERKKKCATKEKGKISTLCCCCICIWIPTAAAVFCNFCDFLSFIFGGPRKALGNIQARWLHPEHTANKTHNTFILAAIQKRVRMWLWMHLLTGIWIMA